MRHTEDISGIHLGFQLAPMIDVVFVLMLFFMLMAGAVKMEREIRTAMPGSIIDDSFGSEELTIAITEDGTVTMNDEEFDSPTDKKLPRLTTDLSKLKKDSDLRGSKVLVTLQTETQVRYERIMDVLNALAKAKITNVTFTLGEEM